MPVTIRMAPAIESPGVIIGGIGRPSMIVTLVLVTFSEPLGIGVAIPPMKVVAAADDASGLFDDIPDGVPCLDEALKASPLDDGDGFVDAELLVCSSVDRGDWDVLVLGSVVGSAAAEAELAS